MNKFLLNYELNHEYSFFSRIKYEKIYTFMDKYKIILKCIKIIIHSSLF